MTNKWYSIDDGNGTNAASGIQSFDRAVAIAQRVANDTGMVAVVYSDDGDEWTVDPPATAAKAAMNAANDNGHNAADTSACEAFISAVMHDRGIR